MRPVAVGYIFVGEDNRKLAFQLASAVPRGRSEVPLASTDLNRQSSDTQLG